MKESQIIFDEIQKLQTNDGFTKELHNLIIKYAEVLNIEHAATLQKEHSTIVQ